MRASRLLLLTGGGVAFDPAAKVLFEAMTTQPSGSRKALVNRYIRALKAAGIWDKLDCLWVMAAHTQQAANLNWVDPGNFTLSPQSSPTFTADQGYLTNGSSSYVSTGFAPHTEDGNGKVNNTHLSIRSLTSDAGSNTFDMGARDGAALNRSEIAGRVNGGGFSARVNQDGGVGAGSAASSKGQFIVSRTASTGFRAYYEGQVLVDITATSSARPSSAIIIGATNQAGTPTGYTARRYASASIGAGLSDAEAAAFYAADNAYMLGVGAVA